MRRMNFPERSKINITQLWPCGPTEPGSHRFIPKRMRTPSSQSLFIAFLPSRSQMSKPIQNPKPTFFEYFLEIRAGIFVAPTFKEKLSLQASRAFPEGAPRKVSMFKIYLAGRSSDMSVSCPETIFFSPKWQDSGCGFFRVLTFQEHKLLTCQEPGMLGVGNPFSEKMFQKH